MDDPFQQLALGRANAACAAIFALLERLEGDMQLASLLASHAGHAKDALLNTMTPDLAISEFDKTIGVMKNCLAKNP